MKRRRTDSNCEDREDIKMSPGKDDEGFLIVSQMHDSPPHEEPPVEESLNHVIVVGAGPAGLMLAYVFWGRERDEEKRMALEMGTRTRMRIDAPTDQIWCGTASGQPLWMSGQTRLQLEGPTDCNPRPLRPSSSLALQPPYYRRAPESTIFVSGYVTPPNRALAK